MGLEPVGGALTLMRNMLIAAVVVVPLAVWKAIEIIIWLVHHVHIGGE